MDTPARPYGMLMSRWIETADRLHRLGAEAVARAHAAGAPAYYIDPAFGEAIVKEMPDGARCHVRADGAHEVVIGALPSRR